MLQDKIRIWLSSLISFRSWNLSPILSVGLSVCRSICRSVSLSCLSCLSLLLRLAFQRCFGFSRRQAHCKIWIRIEINSIWIRPSRKKRIPPNKKTSTILFSLNFDIETCSGFLDPGAWTGSGSDTQVVSYILPLLSALLLLVPVPQGEQTVWRLGGTG